MKIGSPFERANRTISLFISITTYGRSAVAAALATFWPLIPKPTIMIWLLRSVCCVEGVGLNPDTRRFGSRNRSIPSAIRPDTETMIGVAAIVTTDTARNRL